VTVPPEKIKRFACISAFNSKKQNTYVTYTTHTEFVKIQYSEFFTMKEMKKLLSQKQYYIDTPKAHFDHLVTDELQSAP
jgi:hypothetical protein